MLQRAASGLKLLDCHMRTVTASYGSTGATCPSKAAAFVLLRLAVTQFSLVITSSPISLYRWSSLVLDRPLVMMHCVCWPGITRGLRLLAKAAFGSIRLSLSFPISLIWRGDKRSPERMRTPAALQSHAACMRGVSGKYCHTGALRYCVGLRVPALKSFTESPLNGWA